MGGAFFICPARTWRTNRDLAVAHPRALRRRGRDGRALRRLEFRRRPVERLTIVSALLNVGLSASKGVAGVAARSPVLIADAAHSLSDLCSDAIVWWALKMGMRKPTRGHPAGFGKFADWRERMADSRFSLVPRGFGRTSYDARPQTTLARPPPGPSLSESRCHRYQRDVSSPRHRCDVVVLIIGATS